MSSALEVGHHTTGDAHDVIRVCTEVVFPRTRRSPHLVVLQQIQVNEHMQLSCAAKGRHAVIGLSSLP